MQTEIIDPAHSRLVNLEDICIRFRCEILSFDEYMTNQRLILYPAAILFSSEIFLVRNKSVTASESCIAVLGVSFVYPSNCVSNMKIRSLVGGRET